MRCGIARLALTARVARPNALLQSGYLMQRRRNNTNSS